MERKLHNEELLWSALLTIYYMYSGDQMKKNETGGELGTCGGQGRRVQGFGGET